MPAKLLPIEKGNALSEETTRAAEAQEAKSSETPEVTNEQASEQESQVDEAATSQEEEAQSNEEMVPKSELSKRNKEAESLRKRLRQFEQAEEKRRKEQLSQTEQLQEENNTLNERVSTLTNQVKRYNFERALNLPDADLAWGMLQDLGLEVDWSDEYKANNIDDIRSVLKREKPRIWGNGSANGGEKAEETISPSGDDFMNSLFRGPTRSRSRRR